MDYFEMSHAFDHLVGMHYATLTVVVVEGASARSAGQALMPCRKLCDGDRTGR